MTFLSHKLFTKLLLTTSRDCPRRTKRFLKDLSFFLKDSSILNRGKASLANVFTQAYELQCKTVLIISSRKGNPSLIRGYIFHEHKEKIDYLWLFDFKLDRAMLSFELDPPKRKQRRFDTFFDVSELPNELKLFFSLFFKNNFSNTASDAFFTAFFFHEQPGFLIQFKNTEGDVYAPEISIEEIIINEEINLSVLK